MSEKQSGDAKKNRKGETADLDSAKLSPAAKCEDPVSTKPPSKERSGNASLPSENEEDSKSPLVSI